MEDPYLDPIMCRDRLLRDWRTHGSIIVAYDLDDTVFDYHEQGHSYLKVWKLLVRCKALGAYMIVTTAKPESEYHKVAELLTKLACPFDSINVNAPFVKNMGTAKIFCNILLDDKAGLRAAYEDLLSVVSIMEVELGRPNR